jgi:Zn-dependent protease
MSASAPAAATAAPATPPAAAAGERLAAPASAALPGTRVSVDVTWLAALALGTWTFADGLLPAVVDGRGTAAYWTAGAAATLLVLGSLAAHELGHCWVARRHGLVPRRIVLALPAGVIEFDADPLPALELRITGGGTLASLAVAAAAALVHVALAELDVDPLAVRVAAAVALANVGIALANALPIWPLDGGRALRAAVARLSGRRAVGLRAARAGGQALGGLLVVLAVVASASGDVVSAMWAGVVGLSVRHAAGLGR